MDSKSFNCFNVMNKNNLNNNSDLLKLGIQQSNMPLGRSLRETNKSASRIENNKSFFKDDSILTFGRGKREFKDFNCLNIGVPTNQILSPYILYTDIMSIGNGNNGNDIYWVLNYNYLSIIEKINKQLGVKYSFLSPMSILGVTLYTDENLNTNLVFSTFEFAVSILRNFEGKELIADLMRNPSVVGKELVCRLSNLRNIMYPKQFKKQYPYLFEMYETVKNGVTLINALKISTNKMKKDAVLVEFLKRWGGTEAEWMEYSNDFSLEKYVNDIADMYELYFNNLGDVFNVIGKTPIYFTKSCNIDEKKLSLLAAFCSLVSSNIDSLDINDKQKYLYYVASYIKEYKNKQKGETLKVIDISKNVKSLSQKTTISYDYISKCFSDLLVDNPELSFIDFSRDYFSGMTNDEIEKYMESYLNDVRLNWDFLPPGDDTVSNETFSLIQEESKKHKEIDEEAFKQHLIELFMEKKSFFESSDPFCVLKGKGAFSGYVGYCYSNGKIILDKYYENDKKKKLAFGEAIYVMDLFNFYALSKMSKRALISGNLCKRYYHRGEWKERVKEEIESGNPIAKSELGVLIKKMNTKKDV